MNTVSLNRLACQNNGITLDEALLMLVIYNKANLEIAEKQLIKKGFITAERNDLFQQIGWRLTNIGSALIENVVLDSDKQVTTTNSLETLAKELKSIFPSGKKLGTNYYWTDGVALIVRRLKVFFKKYGSDFTNEQIIEATKKYVQSFNGNYQYMRLLKYFIFKEKQGVGGEIEGESELLNYIENYTEEDIVSRGDIGELL